MKQAVACIWRLQFVSVKPQSV